MNESQSPFKFLDAYRKEDKEIFFGRDEEISKLYQLVLASRLVLVYGFSGIGKTSLIRCGLENKFESSDWLPLFIRRSQNIMDALDLEIQQAAHSAIPFSKIDEFGDENPVSISEKLKLLYLDHYKPVFLIFDQFEELFILANKAERAAFFQALKEILASDLQVRVILSMREEYIARLSSYEEILPNIFENRMRLESMSRENIKTVIRNSCDAHDIVLTDGEHIIDRMLENLINPEEVLELSNLQIYLDRLYEEANKLGKPIAFSLPLLGKVGKLRHFLSDFLKGQIDALENQLYQRGVSEKGIPFELLFELTTEEKTKRSVEVPKVLDRIMESYSISQENIMFCLEELKKARIIKEVS